MFCPHCGTANADGSSFCAKCGKSLSGAAERARWAPTQAAMQATDMPPAAGVVIYSGFWRRVAATFIDGLLLSVVAMVLVFVLGIGIATSAATGNVGAAIASLLLIYALAFVGQWLYYALMESSAKQATIGKMALGIKVTDLEGRRIGFGRATGRYFGKIVSGMILYIGFIMVAFTARKQGLHDMMAGALVVRQLDGAGGSSPASNHPAGVAAPQAVAGAPAPRGLPGWAIALIVVGALIPLMGILAAIAIPAYQSYNVRAQVAQGIQLAGTLKAGAGQRIAASDRPVAEVMASLQADPQQSDYVQSVSLANGAIVITYGNRAASTIAGGTLALVPERTAAGEIRWLCGYHPADEGADPGNSEPETLTTIERKFLPANCRG